MQPAVPGDPDVEQQQVRSTRAWAHPESGNRIGRLARAVTRPAASDDALGGLDEDGRLAFHQLTQLDVAHLVEPDERSPHPFIIELDRLKAPFSAVARHASRVPRRQAVLAEQRLAAG
jgi:hypothetical protein